ncbi:MAG: 3-isopropylmalate dehydratase small subunit [Deltaproteobacteria bacterium]|nr:3-isopropylmalate dehydratase small subunit [Deltaproteobacteria bacterium]
MKDFSGNVLFLDRDDINTDEIIPAKYLTENTKEALAPYLLEDLNLEEFDPLVDVKACGVIVTRSNFGCGSSREHAPWALEANGINLVIAESFARIFRQNMYNCGMLAVEVEKAVIDRLFKTFAGLETRVETDLTRGCFEFIADDLREVVPFTISGFDRELVDAGGWVNYADANY